MGTWMILTDLPQPESENRGVNASGLEPGQPRRRAADLRDVHVYRVKSNSDNATWTRDLRSMQEAEVSEQEAEESREIWKELESLAF